MLCTSGIENDARRWRARKRERRTKMVEFWRQRNRRKALWKDGKPRRCCRIGRSRWMGELEVSPNTRTPDMIPTSDFNRHREEFASFWLVVVANCGLNEGTRLTSRRRNSANDARTNGVMSPTHDCLTKVWMYQLER